MKVRQIRKCLAKLCPTQNFHFANVHGFTRPPTWVPCLFILKEQWTILCSLRRKYQILGVPLFVLCPGCILNGQTVPPFNHLIRLDWLYQVSLVS